jgi:hypothetical protein
VGDAIPFVVCDEHLSRFLKLMLCQFGDGTVAPPVFLIPDESIPEDKVVKVRVPLLFPYQLSGAVGPVWLSNPSRAGKITFYKQYIIDIRPTHMR